MSKWENFAIVCFAFLNNLSMLNIYKVTQLFSFNYTTLCAKFYVSDKNDQK